MASRGERVSLTMNDGATIGVYRVHPKGKRRGGLVLVQEIFGVTEHIRELCDGFADQGYEVMAPALFDREAPGLEASYSEEDVKQAVTLAREKHPFDQSLHDTQTCIDQLRDRGSVFITGYCYGGSVTWAAACRCEGLAAASAYYGSLIPKLVDEVPRCPIILHFGKHDKGIPLEGVEQVQSRHPDVPVYLYDAGHGFNSDRRDSYDAHSAQLALKRTLELFHEHGG